MLSLIRDKLKTWVVVILVILVAIPLVFLGVGDYGTSQEQYALKVNDQEISKSVVLQEMSQFKEVLRKEIDEIHHESIKIKFIGDLTPFPGSLKSVLSSSENLTKNNGDFILNVCVNYGGRQEIVNVAREIALKSFSGEIKPSEVNEELFNSELLTQGIKDPELLIRTSGEKRISNFLLWQLAYSEIYISDVLWPDFNEYEFLKAIIDYQSRNRRFGGIESIPKESLEDSYCSS